MAKTQQENTGRSSEDKKIIAIGLAIIIVFALLVSLVIIKPWEDDNDGESTGETADTISSQPVESGEEGNPSVSEPSSTVETKANGERTTRFFAPDHLGLPEGAEVPEELASATPGQVLPAGPEEAVKKTLTVPTTPRQPFSEQEDPDIFNPKFGVPKDLAREAARRIFTLCMYDNTSYEQNFKKIARDISTKEFYDKGFSGTWTGRSGHNDTWRLYANKSTREDCVQVVSFPVVTETVATAGDEVTYYMRVKQLVNGPKAIPNPILVNLLPFKMAITMKYVDGSWLVNNLIVREDTLPLVY